MNMSPAIHIRDNGDGTMTAREMFRSDSAPFTFAASHFLTAAQRYLASRWPASEFKKTGWSANAREAIYHFIEGGSVELSLKVSMNIEEDDDAPLLSVWRRGEIKLTLTPPEQQQMPTGGEGDTLDQQDAADEAERLKNLGKAA